VKRIVIGNVPKAAYLVYGLLVAILYFAIWVFQLSTGLGSDLVQAGFIFILPFACAFFPPYLWGPLMIIGVFLPYLRTTRARGFLKSTLRLLWIGAAAGTAVVEMRLEQIRQAALGVVGGVTWLALLTGIASIFIISWWAVVAVVERFTRRKESTNTLDPRTL